MSGAARPLGAADAAVLAALLGVAITVLSYRYGFDNQVAELPLALRAMDPSYLPLDFYTQVSDAPGPKRPFALLLAAIASPRSLPALCFALVCAANAAIGALSWRGAQLCAPGLRFAPPLAAALALSISTFRLGYTGEFYSSELVASHLAEPLVLLALLCAARARALAAAAAAALATALHLSFGLEAGVLALALCAPLRASGLPAGARPGRWLAGACLLAASALAVAPLAWPAGGLGGQDFLAIETALRHPHHNFWSAFPTPDRLRAAAFAVAGAAAWALVARGAASQAAPARRLAALCAGLAFGGLLCIPWLSLAPHPLLAAARPLRLLWIAKWIALLWIAAALAGGGSRSGAGPALRLAIAIAFAASLRPSLAMGCVLALGAIAALALARLPRALGRAATASAAIALLAHALFGASLPPGLAAPGARLRPPLDLDALQGAEVEVARAARALLPRDAVVLTPPGFARFRLVAERAIVVDFKAFPFQAAAMREWRARLVGCYGDVARGGFPGLQELSRRYRERGLAAGNACDYGATHAVLDAALPAPGPVLYRDARYQLVALRPAGQSPAAPSPSR